MDKGEIMNKLIIPNHLFNEMNTNMLKDICFLSVGNEEYEVVIEERVRNSGQYIKIEGDDILKYICLSRSDCSQSRNSFILQNFTSAYQHYLEDNSENKSFEYYIRDFSKPHPKYAVFSYKLLLTIGIKILNLDNVVPSENVDFLDFRTPFLNFKELRKCRIDMQSKNTENNSTLFEETESEVSVYGKSYGANGRETTAICLALKQLVPEKPIRIYNVNETNKKHLASVDRANGIIFNLCGIEVDDGENIDFEITDEKVVAKRDTRKYHYNLLQKFVDKKCYLCDCDIEHMIIGSHIHRVTDILNSTLTDEDKISQIVDCDNGFWLCANHDKLFEYGLIYFENDELKISNKLSSTQLDFVSGITNLDVNGTFKIDPKHFNNKMKNYLEKHRERTNA